MSNTGVFATILSTRLASAVRLASDAVRVIVIYGNLGLCRETRPVRQFREWSDSWDGRPGRFPLPLPSPSGRGNSAHRAVESRRIRIVLRGGKGSPSPKGEGWAEGNEPTAPRGVEALAQACGHYPRGRVASRHS